MPCVEPLRAIIKEMIWQGKKERRYIDMGRTAMKLDTPQIDFSTLTLDRMKAFHLVYHDGEDVLFLQPDMPRPATSFDLEGEIWIRLDPETSEIVGLEIEDFEAIFLRKHPEVAQAWVEVKPLCHRNFRKMKEVTNIRGT